MFEKPIKPKKGAWTTDDEIEYLDNIGQSLKTDGTLRGTKREHLLGYLESIGGRVKWKDVNRGEVTRYAKALLNSLPIGP